MDNLDQVVAMLQERWGELTLEDLRVQASGEKTAIATESLRFAGGQRLMCVVCVAGVDQVVEFRKRFGLDCGDGCDTDWSEIGLIHLAFEAVRTRSLLVEPFFNKSGVCVALAFIAADPDSMRKVEQAFVMPN